MRKRTLSAWAVLICVGLLCMPAWAASDDSDPSFAKQCPAAAKWITAKKLERAKVMPTKDMPPPTRPDLRKELATRAAADQKAREIMTTSGHPDKASIKALVEVDAGNLAWLKSLVTKHGFPTVAKVGKQGVADAWLLVQHADSDPTFQAAVLDQLTPRLATGAIEKKDYALLTDRVRLAQGKKQTYGSQITVNAGVYVPRPTDDMAHLAQRRAKMDLLPLDDYLCVIRATYGPAPKNP